MIDESIKDNRICRHNSVNTIHCKKSENDLNICGKCPSCIFTKKLSDSTQWLSRAGDASKRNFLTGILVRCHNVNILQKVLDILQVTFGKDFTYTRSKKPSLSEDMRNLSSDRRLDATLLSREMVETWNWFSDSHDWTKSNYLLAVLTLCNTELLRLLGNLTSVLLAKEKQTFSKFREDLYPADDFENDASSMESNFSFHSEDRSHLDLLVQASSVYGPVDVFNDSETVLNSAQLGIWELPDSEFSEFESLTATKVNRVDNTPITSESFKGKMVCEDTMTCSDSTLSSSDDPALMDLPRSSAALSGASCYRDFIRALPVHIAKKILAFLGQACIRRLRTVSSHWRYLIEDTLNDIRAKRLVRNQAMAMQSNINSGISPVYAKVRQVLVPLRDNEMQFRGDVFTNDNRDWSFEKIYAGVRTRPVQMEERNVYCGEFNVLILLDKEDPHRVVHYGGGNLVAMGSKDRTVRVLDVTAMKKTRRRMQGHAGSVRAVVLCERRGLVISAGYDLTIRCWHLTTAKCFMIFSGHVDTITCLDLEGSRLVSGSKDCNVKVWDLDLGRCVHHLKFKHQTPIQCVKINTLLVISSCDNGQVKLWDLHTGVLLKSIDAHAGPVKCLYFDHTHILTGGPDGQAKAWSINRDFKKCLMTYDHPMNVLTLTLLFLRVITGGADGKIRIFSFLTGECLRAIKTSSSQSPVTSLFTRNNALLVHTASSVQLYQFAGVEWDYSLTSEREDVGELCGADSKSSFTSKTPSAFIRAERTVQMGPTNREIYDRQPGKTDGPTLSHLSRSLSAPSMRQAQASQRESLRPATWCERQDSKRSKVHIDLQPEFPANPPSAICPGRPVHGRSQDSQSRASRTPRSARTFSARDHSVTSEWSMTCSETAVQGRVKKKGPRRSLTTDRVLLKLNASRKPLTREGASLDREPNAGVRDAWNVPSPPAPASGHIPTPSTEKRTSSPVKQTARHRSPSSHQVFHGMTWTYDPIITKAMELTLKGSLPGRGTHGSTPGPSLLRLQSGDGLGDPCYQKTMDGRSPTACGPRAASRKASRVTTAAEREATPHPRMLMRAACKNPGRHVNFALPGQPASQVNPLDPFRERVSFRLLTDSQFEDLVEAQSQSSKQEQRLEKAKSQTSQNKGTLHRRKMAGPVPGNPREGQVYAPELGPDVYI